MLVLRGKTVSSHTDFCNFFDYAELTGKIDEFLIWIESNGSAMLPIRSIIPQICTLIDIAGDASVAISFDENGNVCFAPDIEKPLADLINGRKHAARCISKVISKTALNEALKRKAWCEAMALYCAADKEHFDVTAAMVEACYGSAESVTAASEASMDKTEYKLYSGNVYNYEIYKDTSGLKKPFIIETKKVKNFSPYGGDVANINILKDGRIIQQYKLLQEEYIYINTVDDKFVKALPNACCFGDTLVCRPDFRKKDLVKYTVNKTDAKITKIDVIDTVLYGELSCFSVDYAGGIIALENGRLNNMSCVPYDGVEELMYSDLHFAEVYVKGTKYLILTNTGQIISNIRKLDGLSDIISIGFTNATAYAVKISGEQIDCKINTNKDIRAELNSINDTARETVVDGDIIITLMNDGSLCCERMTV